MIEISNTLFQPLTLQTSRGKGIHLPPRGRLQIPDTDVSDEMRRAARRGFIRLQPANSTVDVAADETITAKSRKRKEG